MKLARETWIIIAIGVTDLISTILFIQKHGAQEANPIFRHYWEMGLFNFVLAKMALLLCPLLILEWARRHKPRLVARALQCTIIGYVTLYGIGVAKLNAHPAYAGDVAYYEANGEGFPPVSKEEIQRLLKIFHERGQLPQPAPLLNPEDYTD